MESKGQWMEGGGREMLSSAALWSQARVEDEGCREMLGAVQAPSAEMDSSFLVLQKLRASYFVILKAQTLDLLQQHHLEMSWK